MNSITNYDGAIVTTPKAHVHPKSLEELQGDPASTGSLPVAGAGHGQQSLAHAVRRLYFLKAFNEWPYERGGIPLLNQSPFVRKEHVAAAYGERWTQLADRLKTVDPGRRMVNEFFGALLS